MLKRCGKRGIQVVCLQGYLIGTVKACVYTRNSLRENCPNTGKYGQEKTSYLDTFHAVTLKSNSEKML